MADALFTTIQTRDTAATDLTDARYNPPAQGAAAGVLALAAKNKSEIWKSVGGARESDAEDLRILALTNPVKYSELKRSAINAIQTVVEAAYISAYNQQKVAGLDEDLCKAAAKKQAMVIKEDQFKTLAIRFPNADDIISKNQHVKTTSSLKY